jgi:hypothetical protein
MAILSTEYFSQGSLKANFTSMDTKTSHRGRETQRKKDKETRKQGDKERNGRLNKLSLSPLLLVSLSPSFRVSLPLWLTEICYQRMVCFWITLLASIGGLGCSPGTGILQQRHASVLRQAENLGLPINMSQEELETLERMGPLLDSVRLEIDGMHELRGKIQNILRGLELLRSDTLHTKPGMAAFRGTWDAITTSWGGAARMLPTDAAVALAAVETSFRSATNTQSSASGLWQLLNPKPPSGAREKFERPTTYWHQMYNDCFDKLDSIENLRLRKHTAGMLAHWLNNARNVDQARGAKYLQDIKVPLIIAQYLNGPSILNRSTERSIRIITQAGTVGKNPPPRIYVARYAVYLAIVRAYNEHTQMEGMSIADSNVSLEERPVFQKMVRKHLWRVLTTPNFGIELNHPSEPTMFEQAKQYITGSE